MSKGKNPKPAMIGHLGIEVTAIARSKKFYESLLGELGCKVVMNHKDVLGISNGTLQVWISEANPPRVKRGSPTGEEFVVADHVAILVDDKETVKRITSRMMKDGFSPLFSPAAYPEFAKGYYAVAFCDPDNYVIEIYACPPERK